jgi:glycosyltransferase involved in cell wall biosynthesis
VLEGLACGATPICFDRPCYRAWFDDMALFVPDTHGEELVEAIVRVMSTHEQSLSTHERLRRRFDWITIAQGFWQALEGALRTTELAPRIDHAHAQHESVQSVQTSYEKRKLIWVGDSPAESWTGFGRASRHIIERLMRRFDVTVIGTTSNGYPYSRTEFPYDIYPFNKPIAELVTEVKPDVVVLQHDPWQVQSWMKRVGSAPCVGVMPIDGKNCRTDYLNGLALAIWWTKFAEREARLGHYLGPSAVIPLGVDTELYKPMPKLDARRAIGLPPSVQNAYIVGVIARNQPRKRLDLTVRHFAEWVKSCRVTNAYLYVQTAATEEAAYDVTDLMRYEGLSNRLILFTQQAYKYVEEVKMPYIYSALDCYFTTTQGEGWCLPAMEAMACGVPVIAPDWSGLGDWARGAAHLVDIADVAGTINPFASRAQVPIGVLGAVPSCRGDVDALNRLYHDRLYAEHLRHAGLSLVSRPEFRWQNIGDAYCDAIEQILDAGSRVLAPAVQGDVERDEVTA